MAETTKAIYLNNNDFIEKECKQSEKLIEKEINKLKVEFNEEKLR